MLFADMHAYVAYLWSELLNYLDAARAGADDPDSLSGCLDALFRPPACMTAWSFERVMSLEVRYVGFRCEALGDPLVLDGQVNMLDALTVHRIKKRAEAL